ncbi:hypothetical protein F5144DRAFT_542670 [Chaetomium tenue]|uniref:Uncharacterized protein n=1 Tax=Chaetomium tenue TaxID=1854479 RepID=A0ACB7PKU1_9PEZI|nr:hypothetical protein F5144DRAFT_542670 [Chaetomium globosum]
MARAAPFGEVSPRKGDTLTESPSFFIMQLSSKFLVALFTAVAVASPVVEGAQTLQKRDCFFDCMGDCQAPQGGSCTLACTVMCSLDYSGGRRISQTNLDDFVHNWNGRLGCFSHTGS